MNDSSPSSASSTKSASDFAQAMNLLRSHLEPSWLNTLQPSPAQAVFTTWITVWMLVDQRLHQNASLAMAVDKFLESMDTFSTNKRVRERTLSANTGGFSRARTRLQVAVLQQAAERVCDSLCPSTPELLSNRRVFCVDGTSVALSPVAALKATWPPCTNQHGSGPWPILRLAMAHELETGLAVRPETGAMYGGEAESEIVVARRLLARIPANSLLLADRNFGVFNFVYDAVQAGHDTMTRLKQDRFEALRRQATPVRPGVWHLVWKPTLANRRRNPELPEEAEVLLFLHEFVGYSGQTLWVATTLDLPTDRVAACYARRTEIETDIRQWKKTLESEAMGGQSPEMILKEVAITAIAYNLVTQIRSLASARGGIPVKRISFGGVWSVVIHLLLNRDDRTAEEWEKQLDFVLSKVLPRKLPNRPGRSFPRTAYTIKPSLPKETPAK